MANNYHANLPNPHKLSPGPTPIRPVVANPQPGLGAPAMPRTVGVVVRSHVRAAPQKMLMTPNPALMTPKAGKAYP